MLSRMVFLLCTMLPIRATLLNQSTGGRYSVQSFAHDVGGIRFGLQALLFPNAQPRHAQPKFSRKMCAVWLPIGQHPLPCAHTTPTHKTSGLHSGRCCLESGLVACSSAGAAPLLTINTGAQLSVTRINHKCDWTIINLRTQSSHLCRKLLSEPAYQLHVHMLAEAAGLHGILV